MRPILRKTLNRNRWWALFNTAASFAYDLVNNRYMRSGGASTQALSLTGVPSGQPVQGVGMTLGAADNPVVTQGLGDELLADGDTPHDWNGNGVTLTDNLDGTTTIASTGASWNRAFTLGTSEVGQILHVVACLKAGTSGKARVNILDTISGLSSSVVGTLGSLSSTSAALGSVTNITQVLSAGVWRIAFDFTPNASTADLHVAIGPYSAVSGEDVIAVSLSAKQVLPYTGYNTDGTLSGDERIPNSDVSGWEISAANNVAFMLDGVRLDASPDQGEPHINRLVENLRVGGVHSLSFNVASSDFSQNYPRVSLDGSSETPYLVGAISFQPYADEPLAGFFLADTETHRLYVKMSGQRVPTSLMELNNFSFQEVEPGVVIEAVGVWGNVEDNRFLKLTDNDDNHIIVRRSASGKVHLRLTLGGVTTDYVSATDWPDDVEGTLRLELTDTDGGCFVAVFLDDVFVIGSDAFDYPQPINQLVLAPVSGVKTVMEIYGK